MYKYYGGIFPTFDLFKTVYIQLTEDFGSMVIKNKNSYREIFEKIYYFKAINKNQLPNQLPIQLPTQLPIQQLPIQQFTDFDIKNSRIYLIGKRGSGISFVMLDLLKRFSKVDKFEENLLIINPTEELNPLFSPKYPTSKILYKYDKSILREYFDKIKNMKDTNRNEFNNFSGCIVLNNCLANEEMIKDPEISELFYNAPHYHITFIMSSSYPLGFPPELRSNIDYIFLMYDDVIHHQKRMYEHYGGMLADFDTFKKIYRQLTEDFRSMVIKNYANTQNIFYKFVWFKALEPD